MRFNSLTNKIFILFILVIIISVGIVGVYGFKSTSKAYIESSFKLSDQSTDALEIEIEQKLEHVTKDALFICESYALKKYMIWKDMSVNTKAEELKHIFTDSLIDFLQTKKHYYKARIIDLDGNEIISVNYDEITDTTRLVPDNELQNKKGRGYAEISKKLKKGEFYISDINLNIEHGKIDGKNIPVLRYATPMINDNGELIGIFVVNTYAHHVLDILKDTALSNSDKKIKYFLVNKDGDYFYHEDENKRWNSQLNNGSNFNTDHFKLSEYTNVKHNNVFMKNDKIYSFHTVNPIKDLNDYYWYVISSIDTDVALSELSNFKQIFTLILLSVILVSFFLIRFYLSKITIPLVKVTSQLKSLSEGEIVREKIHYNDNDEISEIVSSTEKLVNAIEKTIYQANAVASGDFTNEIVLLGKNDKLGFALQDMTSRLKEITLLAESLSVGDYDVQVIAKSNEDKLGLALIDMVKYLKNITNIAESIAVGDLDVKYKAQGSDDRLGRAVLQMIKYLRTILKQAKAISKDDFSHSIEVKSQQDELGLALVAMTDMLRVNYTKNKDDIWFSEGIGEFTDTLAGIADTSTLSTQAINAASRYVEACSGVIYTLNKDNDILNLTASFALSSNDKLKHSFKIGVSSIGQVALDKKPMLLTNIIDDEYDIHSGTTVSKPKEVFIFPLLHEGDLFGVAEIMSLNNFTDLQKKYLLKISDILALSLLSTSQNTRIKSLLNDSQKAYQELQVQSEELQESNVQMEEQQQQLTLQAKDMKIKNNELIDAKHELDNRSKKLEKASKYKNEFLANMSHELRTPLNSIILLSKLLTQNQNNTLTKSDIEKSNVINRAGNDLLFLINDILDLSKIESGNMELMNSKVFSSDIVDELRGLFNEVAKDKNIKFIVDDKFKDSFVVDKIKFLQVIKNLLSNALKFTKEGSVKLTIYDKNNELYMDVTDTGVGIPKDKLSLIFDAFKQVDGTISREYGGTGLGLSISKTFINLMKGKIEVTSEENKGSTFSIVLPLIKSLDAEDKESNNNETIVQNHNLVNENTSYTQSSELEESQYILDGEFLDCKNIMIVDDDSRNIFTLSSILQGLGAETFSALHGSEAIHLLEEEKSQMDVILMDIMMPVMDGLDAIKQIKSDERFKHIPIIAITAKTMKEDKKICFEAGANDYLAKPIDQNALLAMLKAWVN